jgi:Flp pilus assembly pilin Flp
MNGIRGQFGLLKVRLGEEDGQVLVEYAILVSLVVIVCVGIISTIGLSISGLFSQVVAQWP